MAKSPRAGLVKTRLCPPCAPAEAARLAEAALADTLAAGRAVPGAEVVLVLDGPVGPWLPPGVTVIPQRGAPLGTRLAAAFEDAGTPALLVGMDTPQLTPELLRRAIACLDAPGVDAVLGPAMDGGVWLIGLNQQRDAARESKLGTIFEGIDWSTPRVLEQLAGRLAELKARFCLLPPWFDVDEPDDLQVLRGQLRGWRWSQDRQADFFPATMAVLDDFERRSTL